MKSLSRSPPQELEMTPRSRLYLLVPFNAALFLSLIELPASFTGWFLGILPWVCRDLWGSRVHNFISETALYKPDEEWQGICSGLKQMWHNCRIYSPQTCRIYPSLILVGCNRQILVKYNHHILVRYNLQLQWSKLEKYWTRHWIFHGSINIVRVINRPGVSGAVLHTAS